MEPIVQLSTKWHANGPMHSGLFVTEEENDAHFTYMFLEQTFQKKTVIC